MNAAMNHHPAESGDAWPLSRSWVGEGGHLRDADWASAPRPLADAGAASPAQRLYRWGLPAGAAEAGLLFLALDGNPRHGVLALFLPGSPECQAAIEILERQGRWMLMPDRGRARQLVARQSERSARRPGRVSTPDRRYVFSNVLQDGDIVTVVERRQDVAPSPSSSPWPR